MDTEANLSSADEDILDKETETTARLNGDTCMNGNYVNSYQKNACNRMVHGSGQEPGSTARYNGDTCIIGNHVNSCQKCACNGMVQCRGQVTRVRVENPNLRILATLLYALCSMCCNICFGLAAFASALSASGDADKGEYEEAKMKSRKSCVLATIAILIGIPMFVAVAVFAGREMNNALALVNDANRIFDLVKRTKVLDMFDRFLEQNNS